MASDSCVCGELLGPSEFVANALRKETDKPITVIPYGINVPCDETATRASFGLPEDRFCVLVMYDSNSYASRKNPAAAIMLCKGIWQAKFHCASGHQGEHPNKRIFNSSKVSWGIRRLTR